MSKQSERAEEKRPQNLSIIIFIWTTFVVCRLMHARWSLTKISNAMALNDDWPDFTEFLIQENHLKVEALSNQFLKGA